MKNSKYKRLLFPVFLLLSFNIFAQLSYHEPLPSAAFGFVDSLKSLNMVITNQIDSSALIETLDSLSVQTGIVCYGKAIPCDLDVKNLASHQSDSLGDLYRLKFIIPGAKGLQFYFDQFHLPFGAILWFYDPEFRYPLGAFTTANNNSQNKFATQIIPSDTIILEYFEPKDSSIAAHSMLNSPLHITALMLTLYADPLPGGWNPGLSGQCEVDIKCPQGNGWTENNSSALTLLYLAGGIQAGGECSGNVLNDEPQDGNGYFLTASHCYDEGPCDPAYTLYYFHYDAQSCGVLGAPSQRFTAVGSTMLSTDHQAASDYALLELFDNPVQLSYLYPCYEGWDYSGNVNPGDPVTVIHHPQADVTKISSGSITNNSSNYFWDVNWNNYGIIEPGSSGASLYDQNHHAIGQVEGYNMGPPFNDILPYCNGTAPGGQGTFGRFDVDYSNGSFAQYLDPYGVLAGSGQTTINTNCSSPINPIGNSDPYGYNNSNALGGCATLNIPFWVNNQNPNISNVAYVCQGDPLKITSCVALPVYEINNPGNNGWWYTIGNWFSGNLQIPVRTYFTSFIDCGNDMSTWSSDYEIVTNHQDQNFSADWGDNCGDQMTDCDETINELASDAGINLNTGHYYRFKIGATYECGLGYHEYAWFFYITPDNFDISNTELKGEYLAANEITLQNDNMNSGDVATIQAGNEIDFQAGPGSGIIDIKPGSNLDAFIQPNTCFGGHSPLSKPLVTKITLPNDFYFGSTYHHDSLQNLASLVNINVIPNPSTGRYTITFTKDNYFKRLSVCDLLGRIIYQNSTLSGSETQINLTSFASGVYVLKTEDINGKQYENKLIKN